MARKVTEIYGGEPYEYYPLGKYIVQAPGIQGGEPTFKYTRIVVSYVLEYMSNGRTVDEIVEDFEGRVSKEALLEALALATKSFRKVYRRK